MDVVCLQKPRPNLFLHIFLVFISLCFISGLEHCICKFASGRRWPRCTNKWMSRNQHIVIAIRKCLGCQFNHFICIHFERTIEITCCIISCQFWIHVGTRFQMFCIHCVRCQIILDRYIHEYWRPTGVFQPRIRVWIIGEEKAIMEFGRTRWDFISLIGVRAEKTSVKCNLHL